MRDNCCKASSKINSSESPLTARESRSSKTTLHPPFRLDAQRSRAESTRIWRISREAIATKCERFCQPHRLVLPQPQIGLVHQGSALQGMIRAFRLKMIVSQPPQLLIDQGWEGMKTLLVAPVFGILRAFRRTISGSSLQLRLRGKESDSNPGTVPVQRVFKMTFAATLTKNCQSAEGNSRILYFGVYTARERACFGRAPLA